MNIVFLDRDGVINKFPGHGNYVTKVKDFHFIPGALEAIRDLTQSGYHLFVVSNQAGVGKGVYSRFKLDQITHYMMKHVRREKGKIKRVMYCTHRSDHGCDCRKPEIGNIVKGFKVLNKSSRHANKAFFVGDTESDIQAGHNAGCKTIFVLSGHSDRRAMRKWNVRPDYIAKDLREASRIILKNNLKTKNVKSRN
jgi:D-glycero-D-manno-heptose 1,7-bisphosphate phosphatase